MYGKINIILDSQQTGPASGMVSSIASEPLPSFFDKIEIIDYNNDFIGTILYDIFESNLNIVKKTELNKLTHFLIYTVETVETPYIYFPFANRVGGLFTRCTF